METLSFGITGEFITKTAREWFYIEHKDYAVVEELLLSCMCGTDLSKSKLKHMAQDILAGRAELTGNSWDGTFTYRELSDEISPKIDIFAEYVNACQKIKIAEDKATDFANRFNQLYDALTCIVNDDPDGALDAVSEYPEVHDLISDILVKLQKAKVQYTYNSGKSVILNNDKPTVSKSSDAGDSILDSYLKQCKIEEQFDDNYGFVEPDGTFHPAPWGTHQEAALKILKERGWRDEFHEWDNLSDLPSDFLIEVKGWILLHNPGMGVAYISRRETNRLTKAQSEFLYDYFTKRGLHAKAKEYLEERGD